MSDYAGPLPKATPETKPYWDGLRARKLMLPRCPACGRAHFFPRPFCPHCGGRKVEWFEASGKGRLYTFVINHRPPPYLPKDPYVIAVIELDEGPRLMSNLVGVDPDPAKIRCDARVEIEYDDVTPEVTLPRFRLAEGAK
jgi:uncharacterized OB-fold protein